VTSVCCHTTLWKLEVWNCGNFQKKNNLKIMSHLTKTGTSLVIWLNIVTIVARSVRLLPTYICEDVHVTRQLHCQWWSGQCHDKHAENAASVHNTLYKIVWYLQRIFNRNRKLKQVCKLSALKLGVCSKIKVCYVCVCIFFQICQKLNFPKVVRQHTEGSKYYTGFVGNVLGFLAVKEFWKSVKNWQSYCHEFSEK